MTELLAVFALCCPTAFSDTQAMPEHLIHRAIGSFIPPAQGNIVTPSSLVVGSCDSRGLHLPTLKQQVFPALCTCLEL